MFSHRSPTQPSIPPGSVNEYQLRLRRQGRHGTFRWGWTRGVQVKLWDPLRTRAIPQRFRGVITRRYTNPRLHLLLPSYNSQDKFDTRHILSHIFCSHKAKQYAVLGMGGGRAWARALDLPARSFDLARPGVAPPLWNGEGRVKFRLLKSYLTARCEYSASLQVDKIFFIANRTCIIFLLLANMAWPSNISCDWSISLKRSQLECLSHDPVGQ